MFLFINKIDFIINCLILDKKNKFKNILTD